MPVSTLALPVVAADRLQAIARLAQLFKLLRGINGPLTSPENLRQLLHTLGEIGKLIGLDAEWLERLEQIVTDERVFQIVLAIVRALAGWSGTITPGASSNDHQLRVAIASQQLAVDAQSFIDWLPIVVTLIQLLRDLRGAA